MHDILNLERYPLDKSDSTAWRDLVGRCQQALEQDGMFTLTDFMHMHIAAGETARMADTFATQSFRHERVHNIYFLKSIPDLAPDHPALTQFHTSNQTLCADQISGSALLRLYEWPPFARFLAATMGQPALYVMEDPLARVNVMSYDAGQALNWHFDRSEFTTTLLLQAPEAGGAFEYRTDLRSDDDPNYDGVARLLTGQDDQVHTLSLTPGSLNVFKGRNTAHRVSPVEGDTPRVISVFSYYDRPGVRFTQSEQIGFYGRSA
ncbi:HalD/BesD family halogenase [Roseovarius rhodophyticola]|uniref:2OG-Fe(II) oxygenase n=1 Tax=Roseovarius rhodophyticola TaxID=3080827 RepID=A0ABZ2TFH2_9RHOB|nr:2OG-Fe(II) oxygenase [Roseovarius sp. W115]MDV2928743.1 2OG-Fe(II) oxygenase [Roseovarius sp. W115]